MAEARILGGGHSWPEGINKTGSLEIRTRTKRKELKGRKVYLKTKGFLEMVFRRIQQGFITKNNIRASVVCFQEVFSRYLIPI